jgi:dCMP deaminase
MRGDCIGDNEGINAKDAEARRMHSHDHVARERDSRYETDFVLRPNEKWDRRMLELATTVSTWSKDPSTKIGAVIVRPDKTVASLGFNGFPRGMSDATEYYADRETKLSRVVHAEMNAILSAHGPVKSYTMFSTLFPCSGCALHIIQAGIVRVVAKLNNEGVEGRWKDSFEKTRNFFNEAGVEALLYP